MASQVSPALVVNRQKSEIDRKGKKEMIRVDEKKNV